MVSLGSVFGGLRFLGDLFLGPIFQAYFSGLHMFFRAWFFSGLFFVRVGVCLGLQYFWGRFLRFVLFSRPH